MLRDRALPILFKPIAPSTRQARCDRKPFSGSGATLKDRRAGGGMAMRRGFWVVVAGGAAAVALASALSFASHQVTAGSRDQQGEHEAIVYRGITACGVERWAVKTGTARETRAVNQKTIVPATIFHLRSLPAPAALPNNTSFLERPARPARQRGASGRRPSGPVVLPPALCRSRPVPLTRSSSARTNAPSLPPFPRRSAEPQSRAEALRWQKRCTVGNL
jgi:hypothetical protein